MSARDICFDTVIRLSKNRQHSLTLPNKFKKLRPSQENLMQLPNKATFHLQNM